MSQYALQCNKCGKYHNFGRCPKCGTKVKELNPKLEEQRCGNCGRVLHRNGGYLCDGKTDGGKCGSMIPAPDIIPWPKRFLSWLGDFALQLIGIVIIFVIFIVFAKACQYTGALINIIHDDLGCGGKTTVQKTVSPDDQ